MHWTNNNNSRICSLAAHSLAYGCSKTGIIYLLILRNRNVNLHLMLIATGRIAHSTSLEKCQFPIFLVAGNPLSQPEFSWQHSMSETQFKKSNSKTDSTNTYIAEKIFNHQIWFCIFLILRKKLYPDETNCLTNKIWWVPINH